MAGSRGAAATGEASPALLACPLLLLLLLLLLLPPSLLLLLQLAAPLPLKAQEFADVVHHQARGVATWRVRVCVGACMCVCAC